MNDGYNTYPNMYKKGKVVVQNELDMLKVLTILLVVLAHVTRMYSGLGVIKMEQNEVLTLVTRYIYSFHMPLFVSISGAIYYIGKREKGKYTHRINFMKSKFSRLIIPYVFFSLFIVFPTMLIIGAVHEPPIFFIFRNYFLAYDPRHLWYVLMLFILFASYDLFEHAINQHIVLFLIIFLFLNLISSRIPALFQIGAVARYSLYFHIGYVYRKFNIINRLSIKNTMFYIFLHLVFFVFIDIYLNDTFSHFLQPLVSISGSLMMAVISKKILNYKWMFQTQLLSNSYGIYLVHPMIIYLLFFYFGHFTLSPFLFTFLFFSISLLLSLVLTVLCRRIGFAFVIGEK